MGLRSFFFGLKKDPKHKQGRPVATLTNISYPIHVLTTNPIGNQYPPYFTTSSRPLRSTTNGRWRGGGEEGKPGREGGRERKRRSDMSFSCVGSEDSNPSPPPPPPPLVKRYTGGRDNHLSILAPTECDEWVPPRGVVLKTDVICFSCRKAPGRDDIGLCKNCKRLHPPPSLLTPHLFASHLSPSTNQHRFQEQFSNSPSPPTGSPILSNPKPRDSRFTVSNYTRDSFCRTNTTYRHISQHGSMIQEEDEVVEDGAETNDGIVDFSDSYYALWYEEWREQEEQNIRREEERTRRIRADKCRGRGGVVTQGAVGYRHAGSSSQA